MSDAFVILGAIAIAIGLLVIHPALLLVAAGVLALRHGLERE